jgi:DNA modification methylase
MNDVPPEFFTVHSGDARYMNRLLDRITKPNEPNLTCTITSPPYGAVKNYGHEDQIGWGQPYDEYLVEMRRIFRTTYRYTRPDGSLWVIADSLRSEDTRSADLPQQMEPLPFQLAEQASDAGWILRETIIWQKKKSLPWSSGRRFRNVFEYVLLFVKSADYKFYTDRLRDPVDLTQWWVKWPERYNPGGKAPINVWDIPIPQQGTWRGTAAKHVCPLPPDLVERLVLLSTDEGDVVFDPFAGTGVVVAEASRLGRRGIGIELNPQYVKLHKIMKAEIAKRSERDLIQERTKQAQELHSRIVRLRALKYAKVLWQKFSKDEQFIQPNFILVQAAKISPDAMTDTSKPLRVKTTFVYDSSTPTELDSVNIRLKEIATLPPLTKYGVAPEISAINYSDLSMHLKREKLFLYEHGHTWDALGPVHRDKLPTLRPPTDGRKGNYLYPPIVGNVEVNEKPDAPPPIVANVEVNEKSDAQP